MNDVNLLKAYVIETKMVSLSVGGEGPKKGGGKNEAKLH
jgi:hypothetical protein